MPRFSANIELLFTEVPFDERFDAAARAGFEAVEFYYPYERDAARLSGLLRRNGLTQTLINSPKGDPEKDEKGFACLPGRRGEFEDSIDLAIDAARTLNCGCVQVMAGRPPGDADFDVVYRTCVDNMRFASKAFARHGIKALIEAVNPCDNPGCFVDCPSLALRIIRDAGAANLFLLFDVYHAQITEGDLAHTIEASLPHIAHIQIADTPGRHEPGTGEIGFPYLFRLIDDLGYAGWIGCEYRPNGNTVTGLNWAIPFLGGCSPD